MVISNVSVWGRGECDPSSGRGECELEVGANVNLVPVGGHPKPCIKSVGIVFKFSGYGVHDSNFVM